MAGTRWVEAQDPGMIGSGQSPEDPVQDSGMSAAVSTVVSGAGQDFTCRWVPEGWDKNSYTSFKALTTCPIFS